MTEPAQISKVVLQLLNIAHALPHEYRSGRYDDPVNYCQNAMEILGIFEPLDTIDSAVYLGLISTKLNKKGCEFIWKLRKADLLA